MCSYPSLLTEPVARGGRPLWLLGPLRAAARSRRGAPGPKDRRAGALKADEDTTRRPRPNVTRRSIQGGSLRLALLAVMVEHRLDPLQPARHELRHVEHLGGAVQLGR